MKTIVILLLSGLWLCSLRFFVLSTPSTYDQYWHAKTGLDFLYNGLSPLVDNYSFTHNGAPIKLQPYAFQALYGYLDTIFGFRYATILIKLAGVTLYIFAAFLFIRRVKPTFFVA